jgi:hypothetical protein
MPGKYCYTSADVSCHTSLPWGRKAEFPVYRWSTKINLARVIQESSGWRAENYFTAGKSDQDLIVKDGGYREANHNDDGIEGNSVQTCKGGVHRRFYPGPDGSLSGPRLSAGRFVSVSRLRESVPAFRAVSAGAALDERGSVRTGNEGCD